MVWISSIKLYGSEKQKIQEEKIQLCTKKNNKIYNITQKQIYNIHTFIRILKKIAQYMEKSVTQVKNNITLNIIKEIEDILAKIPKLENTSDDTNDLKLTDILIKNFFNELEIHIKKYQNTIEQKLPLLLVNVNKLFDNENAIDKFLIEYYATTLKHQPFQVFLYLRKQYASATYHIRHLYKIKQKAITKLSLSSQTRRLYSCIYPLYLTQFINQENKQNIQNIMQEFYLMPNRIKDSKIQWININKIIQKSKNQDIIRYINNIKKIQLKSNQKKIGKIWNAIDDYINNLCNKQNTTIENLFPSLIEEYKTQISKKLELIDIINLTPKTIQKQNKINEDEQNETHLEKVLNKKQNKIKEKEQKSIKKINKNLQEEIDKYERQLQAEKVKHEQQLQAEKVKHERQLKEEKEKHKITIKKNTQCITNIKTIIAKEINKQNNIINQQKDEIIKYQQTINDMNQTIQKQETNLLQNQYFYNFSIKEEIDQ